MKLKLIFLFFFLVVSVESIEASEEFLFYNARCTSEGSLRLTMQYLEKEIYDISNVSLEASLLTWYHLPIFTIPNISGLWDKKRVSESEDIATFTSQEGIFKEGVNYSLIFSYTKQGEQ